MGLLETHCNICNGKSIRIFDAIVLRKYKVDYFKCESCGFIQTEKPFWLNESYHSAIAELDIGLISRNILLSDIVEKMLLNKLVDPDGQFIDYGGGYGMFVRLMRDKGFKFFRQEQTCENIFARHFDVMENNSIGRFDLLTAFEVFEHLEDPLADLSKMLLFSDNILFSTELNSKDDQTPESWWYFVPETGQHISFFTTTALQKMGDKLNLNFYSDGGSLHMFTKYPLNSNPFIKHNKYINKLFSLVKTRKHFKKRQSLLMEDFEFIRKKINNN